MDFWFGRALLLIGAAGGAVAAISWWTARKEERLRKRVVDDVKGWLCTPDGEFFMSGYLRKLKRKADHDDE